MRQKNTIGLPARHKIVKSIYKVFIEVRMLKAIILFFLAFNLSFARDRFTEADKKTFIDDMKQEIAEHKVENQGKVDLQIIKPELNKQLEEYFDQQKFTRAEMQTIKQRYEDFSKDSKNSGEQAEQLFYNFIEGQLSELNKKPIEKIKEGNVCNNWSCQDGLVCAVDPIQSSGNQCKAFGNVCTTDSECCSGGCVAQEGSKQKTCEKVERCFKPLSLGQSCLANPVCGMGSCLSYNALTSGIGECEEESKACKKNSDCCSNLCSGGVCKENVVCKDCISNGQKPQRGQKCCEGLYLNTKGICVPDVPPSVIPQVRVSPLKNFLISFVNLFMSSAEAGTLSDVEKEYKELVDGVKIPTAGQSMKWADGVVTRLDNGKLSYVSNTAAEASDKPKAYVFDAKVSYVTVAKNNPDIRGQWMESYGVDVLGTPSSYASNKKAFDDIFAKTGSPGTSLKLNLSIPGNYFVNFGADGKVASVSTAEGTMSLEAFKASNVYAAATGSAAGSSSVTSENLAGLAPDAGTLDSGATAASIIKGHADKYSDSNFQATSVEAEKVVVKAPDLQFAKKSDFNTCDIRFKDDFYNFLKKEALFDLQLAMLGFDFVVSGDSKNDYWTLSKGNPETSLHARLKAISVTNRDVRLETNKKIDEINKRLTCLCIDAQGFEKIKSEEKRAYFQSNCPDEYRMAMNQKGDFDLSKESTDGGDASGVKGKRLLAVWTSNLATFNQILTINNTQAFTKLDQVSKWASQEAKWSETREKEYQLFKYSIKGEGGGLGTLGAIVGALLAAGVIAILGGFATGSLLTAWAAAGIIAASAATGAGGLWMIASLKGAWITKKPEIIDRDPVGFSCGKKERCTQYTRVLKQPYNDVCNIHASANACVKNFVVVNQSNQSRFLVDPWVPNGVAAGLILKDVGTGTYAEKLEASFSRAKAVMMSKSPGGELSPSYRTAPFVTEAVVGNYVPSLGQDLENTYFMSEEKVKAIKEAAMKFAVVEGFIEESDKENLVKFADYAYTYHFVWPKMSRAKEISYPTIGLTTYLSMMANEVAGEMSVGNGKAAQVFGKLAADHYADYINTLRLYSQANNQTDEVKAATALEMEKAKKELDSLLTVNALTSNQGLSDQLMKLNSTFLNSTAQSAGASGNVTLSSDAQNFLKSIGTLRNARKEQLKTLAAYKKEMASSGNIERANKLEGLSKKFGNTFSKGLKGGGFGLSAVAAPSAASDKGASRSNNNGNNNRNNQDYDNNGTGALFGSGAKYSGSSSGSSSASAEAAANPASEEDSRRLAEAIEARDKSTKEKYQAKDGQSLFEQVTNAYIRNYDKVLVKKKGKDVEQK